MDSSAVYLPLFVRIDGRPCLLVGGGEVAYRKAQQLQTARAKLTVVAPSLCPALERLLADEKCVWQQREYISPEARHYCLVIAATDDPVVNRQIFTDSEAYGVPVNVVDQPQLCSVIFPSVIRRNPITLAVSSGASVPFLTRYLRQHLEHFLAGFHQLDKPAILLQFRDFVRQRVQDPAVKDRLYQRLLACDEKQWAGWSDASPPLDQWAAWIEEEKTR
ncbi:MAG TPA: bifunctional precorrin-2 dehydrogenase/sirohydrochlorin ferrochelatase [bacterium]|jgi:uroporphyrin-III C-methyltransferase/precorrin-2 dehydrogenase/sirohydrochlorin ferrochelatase